MRAFSQADRFLSELESRKLKPAYVLVGDEAFFRKRCRDAILEHLVAPDSRDFGLFEFDLSETSLTEVLDRARTPSLMAPFQVFFVRGVKTLFGRGSSSNAEKIGAIEAYCKNPNPDALLVFVADHISIPADARRMEMTDRTATRRSAKTWVRSAALWNCLVCRRVKPSAGLASTAPRVTSRSTPTAPASWWTRWAAT